MKSYFIIIGKSLLALSRLQKQLVLIFVDLLTVELCLYIALALTTNSLPPLFDIFLRLCLFPLLIALPIFYGFGLYNTIIRYVGLFAFDNILKATIVYSIFFGFLIHGSFISATPLAIINGLLVFTGLGASRAGARKWLSNAQNHGAFLAPRKRVIIYGAGSAGVQLSVALAQSREIEPIAFVDDDHKLHRRNIAGLKVYPRIELENLISDHGISEVLLALPSISRAERNIIISDLEKLSVQVRTLPGVAQLAGGEVKTSDLHDVDVEDLLGRDPVPPQAALLEQNIKNRAVLVTGAGGSIGSELCKQIFMLQPRLLVLYEINEFGLYNIEQQLLALYPSKQYQLITILGSVTDPKRFDLTLKRFEIETVFHSAAYKHVPMVEKNPCAGAYNNILGTWHAARIAQANKVQTFILISTDKAVRPTNTMGTTKRFAELILQALNQVTFARTRFIMVRFGNVLGSSGSVIPAFKKQIKNGGPITVTDPRITRYFMTMSEAAQLVIQASAMGQGGDVFVLDMGDPVKILDLAKKMIRLSGLSLRDEDNPSGDIEIIFSGLRPGEKLYEELLIGDDVTPTDHPKIMRANESMLPLSVIEEYIGKIEHICSISDSYELRQILLSSISEFTPQCGNEDLLSR